jgi:hypothetical protein
MFNIVQKISSELKERLINEDVDVNVDLMVQRDDARDRRN